MKSQLRRHLYVLSPQVCLLYGEGDATTSFCCCQTSQTIFLVFSDSVAYFPDLSRLHLAFNLCGCYSYTHSKWFEKKKAILEFLNKIKIFSSLITWSNKRYYYLKFLFIPFFLLYKFVCTITNASITVHYYFNDPFYFLFVALLTSL